MKTYKVLSINVTGLGNTLYFSGDIVKENNFPPGNADDLVLRRHLKVHDEEATEAEPSDADLGNTRNNPDPAAPKPFNKEMKFGDHSKEELQNKLLELNVAFKKKDGQGKLFNLVLTALEEKE